MTIGSQHLLSVPGRKTGELRSTPVSIATVDGNRYIVAAFLDAAWVRNVRVAGIGTLTRGRSCEDVRLTELSVGERGPVLGRSGSTPRDVPSLVREPLILADHEA